MSTQQTQDAHLLREIQQIDLEADALQEQADAIPKQVQAWRDAIQSHEIEKAMWKRKREELELKQRHFESEIAGKQDTRAKYNQQLTLVKTNREYRALLEELEHVNQSVREHEDIVIAAMTDLESVDTEINHKDEAILSEQQKIEENQQRLDAELAALQEEIGRRQQTRSELATDVDPHLMGGYERVRRRRKGRALVEINVKQETCGGCHMSLTLQDVNSVIGGALIPCSQCGRMLYYDPEEDVSSESE